MVEYYPIHKISLVIGLGRTQTDRHWHTLTHTDAHGRTWTHTDAHGLTRTHTRLQIGKKLQTYKKCGRVFFSLYRAVTFSLIDTKLNFSTNRIKIYKVFNLGVYGGVGQLKRQGLLEDVQDVVTHLRSLGISSESIRWSGSCWEKEFV